MGIYIELIGAVERHGETAKKEDFSASRIQLLAAMADNAITKETIILEFDFGNCRFPYESYDGNGVSLRYSLKFWSCEAMQVLFEGGDQQKDDRCD